MQPELKHLEECVSSTLCPLMAGCRQEQTGGFTCAFSCGTFILTQTHAYAVNFIMITASCCAANLLNDMPCPHSCSSVYVTLSLSSSKCILTCFSLLINKRTNIPNSFQAFIAGLLCSPPTSSPRWMRPLLWGLCAVAVRLYLCPCSTNKYHPKF